MRTSKRTQPQVKILITGGSGLLATNWALTARAEHAVVLALHNREISLRNVATVVLELGAANRLQASLTALMPDLVVHTAGATSVEWCESFPEESHHINVNLTTNVAGACSALKIPMVLISTDHLFAGTDALVDEGCPLAPQNVYGRTKAEAEQRTLESHPSALVVRTNFFGWGTGYRQSFSDRIIFQARAGQPLMLFEDVFFTPILIETLVMAVQDLVQTQASGILHIVGDERISKYEFGHAVVKQFGLDPSLIQTSRISDQRDLVRRPRDMSLSNMKACKLLGRGLGSISAQLQTLRAQENSGMARELQSL